MYKYLKAEGQNSINWKHIPFNWMIKIIREIPEYLMAKDSKMLLFCIQDCAEVCQKLPLFCKKYNRL